MKYHLLIIGFIITLPNIGQEAFAIVEKWEVGIAILPSVIGIAHALGAHKSIGNYDIGFDSDIYEDLLRKENEFVDALKTLSETYDKMIDNNREHLNNNWRHLVIQMILFGASLGVITASIVI